MTDEPTDVDLSAQVARSIFGADLLRIPTVGEPHRYVWHLGAGSVKPILPYDDDIDSAFRVVEKLAEHEQFVDFSLSFNVYRMQDRPGEAWSAAFGLYDHGEGRTAPEAICRAALRAITRLDGLNRATRSTADEE